MIPYHFVGSYLCRLMKGNFFLKPGCFYHTFSLFFPISHRIFYHKSHTINQSNSSCSAAWHLDFYSLFWNKFGFCCHDCFSIGRLWEFIPCSFFLCIILDFRNHHKFHKIFYKCTFPGTDRTYNTKIQFSSGSYIDIFIYIIFIVHKKTPLLNCYSICKGILYYN